MALLEKNSLVQKEMVFSENIKLRKPLPKKSVISNIPHESLLEKIIPIKEISELAAKEGNAKRPVYEIHKWWARRLSVVVRSMLIGSLLPTNATEEQFWERFYSKNSINVTLMDPFLGGGTSLVEAKKMGAKAIGIDIDPMACFITKKELEDCDIDEVSRTYKIIYDNVGKKIKDFYLTSVDGQKHPIINVFWVYEVKCDCCTHKFALHPHYKLYYNENDQYVFCKECGNIEVRKSKSTKFKCSKCKSITKIDSGTFEKGVCTCPYCKNEFKLSGKLNGKETLKMFAIEYEDNGKRCFKKADQTDLEEFNKVKVLADEILKSYYIPEDRIPTDNRKDSRPMNHGYHFYKDLFNSRQLLSLAMIFDEIKKIKNQTIKEWLMIGFSDCLASNNMLCNYAYGYRKLTPLFGIHAYTVPVRPVENNVWGSGSYGRGSFEKTIKKVIDAKRYCKGTYEYKYSDKKQAKHVLTGEKIASIVTGNPIEFYNNSADTLIINSSSENLSSIKNGSVDIILSDPPYYDNLHYSELADFYYQWLKGQISTGGTLPIDNSLYANDIQENYHQMYESRLINIFKECYKKLKNNGIMMFSYHHNKEEAWKALTKAILKSNFIITNVLPIRSEGSSAYHSSDNTIKWDSIIVLRKRMEEYNFIHSHIKEEFEMARKVWEKYFESKDLELKECDKISFYRSLAMKFIVNTSGKTDFDTLFKDHKNS